MQIACHIVGGNLVVRGAAMPLMKLLLGAYRSSTMLSLCPRMRTKNGLEMPPIRMERLSFDPLIRICSYLKAAELGKLMLAVKYLAQHPEQLQLWRAVHSNIAPQVLASLWYNISLESGIKFSGMSLPQAKELARQVSLVQSAEKLQWFRTRYHSLSSPDQLDAMEAHTATSLCDRYVVIVGGWGQGEVGGVYIIDGVGLPRGLILVNVREVRNAPRFRYGFSTTNVGNEFYIFGGCTEGGYGGDCNDFYKLTLTFVPTDPSSAPGSHEILPHEGGEWQLKNARVGELYCIATYSPSVLPHPSIYTPHPVASSSGSATAPLLPITRAYHSCVHIRSSVGGQGGGLLLWGGLHERRVVGRPEYLQLPQLACRAVEAAGSAPSPRFGHSMVEVENASTGNVQVFVMTGGSNGNDLLRNGRELKEIFVLTVQASSDHVNIPGPMLTWSSLPIHNLPHRRHLLPGRCHVCWSTGTGRLVYFGGGAKNSARVVVLDLPKDGVELDRAVDSEARIRCPTIYSEDEPVKRVSSAGCLIGGRFLVVFGGWNNHFREMGDVWCADLAPGTEATVRKAYEVYPSLAEGGAYLQQLVTRRGGEEGEEMESGEEGSASEEEEEDEGGGPGLVATLGGLAGNLLLQLLQQGGMVTSAEQLQQVMQIYEVLEAQGENDEEDEGWWGDEEEEEEDDDDGVDGDNGVDMEESEDNNEE